MKSLNVLILATTFFCVSCTDTAEKSDIGSTKLTTQSYETNGQDTVNRVDQNGLKQGVWKPSPTNKLKETVVYRNDTVIK